MAPLYPLERTARTGSSTLTSQGFPSTSIRTGKKPSYILFELIYCYTLHRLPNNVQTYYKKQPAAHVYNMNAKMFLAPEDHFIASGPLSMIPGNSPRIGLKLSPTPCHLCGHVYGRIIMSNHCRHVVCSYCLGATCLISVDHYICEYWRDFKYISQCIFIIQGLVCWQIPDFVYISWTHRAGEQVFIRNENTRNFLML